MRMREYFELFRYLAEQRCLFQEDVIYVDNIADWCREHGLPESDRQKPFKLISKEGAGCKMLVAGDVPEDVIEQRITAMGIREQVLNVAVDRTGALDSEQKKLAFLFLHEYAFSLPEVKDDEILADAWAFEEMERLGYFRK
jgi:hypothetical protein